MDIHYSENYYWADSLNRQVAYKELCYPDFQTALKAFDKLKDSIKVHPVPVKYRDMDSINGAFLIDNVERAFEAWKKPWAKQLSYEEFCEYLLPYRVSTEPLQFWRPVYQQRFAWVADSAKGQPVASACAMLNSDLKAWFINTFNIEKRREPLHGIGPLQLLFRKQGPCEDMTTLAVYAMRSQGIPCCTDMIPYWGTSSGRHYMDVTLNEIHHPVPFNGASQNPDEFVLEREPAKIIRFTYAKKPGTLADILPENEIPEWFMKFPDYFDVTAQYWPVKDIKCNLLALKKPRKVIYACVFNKLGWHAAWWGLVTNNVVVFKQMACGVVYMPMDYIDEKLQTAGYPVAIAPDGTQQILVPDTANRHTITLREQDKYLFYRTGKRYKLYFWDNNWKLIGEKTAGDVRMLVFDNVPRNALLLMVPEYTQYKERPFTVNDKGERTWW